MLSKCVGHGRGLEGEGGGGGWVRFSGWLSYQPEEQNFNRDDLTYNASNVWLLPILPPPPQGYCYISQFLLLV